MNNLRSLFLLAVPALFVVAFGLFALPSNDDIPAMAPAFNRPGGDASVSLPADIPVHQRNIARAEGLAQTAAPNEYVDALIERLSFLSMPVRGARVPDFAGQLPGSPRSYRNGVHEGVDIYGPPKGTPIYAAGSGVIIRADIDYEELTDAERTAILKEAASSSDTPDDILDRLNGRQVWIHHGDGVITRYSHLDGIPDGIVPGKAVDADTVIGYMGNSGTSDAVANSQDGVHLHFEIIVDGYSFWKDLNLEQVKQVLKAVLTP
ncbi:MAG: M23 family metallopeptidase [Bacillota bacterium]